MTTEPNAGAPIDGHPGDELSALLDGELDGQAAVAVRVHVAGCPPCADELNCTRAARVALRSLPAVEPPPGVMQSLVARVAGVDEGPRADAVPPVAVLVDRRHRRFAAANVAASVAIGVGLLVTGLTLAEPPDYEPRVETAVGRHAASLMAMSAGGILDADGGTDPLRPTGPVTPTTAAPRNPDELPAPFDAPARLNGGYELVDAFANGEGIQFLYQQGRYGLSVFEVRGRLDGTALPAGGRRVAVAGVDGWRWETEEAAGRVVVFERDGLVVTVVGDEPGDAVLEAARSLPGPRPLSLLQRLTGAGASALEALSP